MTEELELGKNEWWAVSSKAGEVMIPTLSKLRSYTQKILETNCDESVFQVARVTLIESSKLAKVREFHRLFHEWYESDHESRDNAAAIHEMFERLVELNREALAELEPQ